MHRAVTAKIYKSSSPSEVVQSIDFFKVARLDSVSVDPHKVTDAERLMPLKTFLFF